MTFSRLLENSEDLKSPEEIRIIYMKSKKSLFEIYIFTHIHKVTLKNLLQHRKDIIHSFVYRKISLKKSILQKLSIKNFFLANLTIVKLIDTNVILLVQRLCLLKEIALDNQPYIINFRLVNKRDRLV